MSCDVLICIDGRRLYLVSASWELPNGGALGLVKVSRLQISFLLASFKLPLRLNRAGSIKAVLIHVSDPFFSLLSISVPQHHLVAYRDQICFIALR
jgi:hypothetical protein